MSKEITKERCKSTIDLEDFINETISSSMGLRQERNCKPSDTQGEGEADETSGEAFRKIQKRSNSKVDQDV